MLLRELQWLKLAVNQNQINQFNSFFHFAKWFKWWIGWFKLSLMLKKGQPLQIMLNKNQCRSNIKQIGKWLNFQSQMEAKNLQINSEWKSTNYAGLLHPHFHESSQKFQELKFSITFYVLINNMTNCLHQQMSLKWIEISQNQENL